MLILPFFYFPFLCVDFLRLPFPRYPLEQQQNKKHTLVVDASN